MGCVLEVVIMVICSEVLIALMVVKPAPSFISGIDLVNGSASDKSKAYYTDDVNYRDDEVLCFLCSCGNPISAFINRSLNKNTQLSNSILLPEFQLKEYLCQNFARIIKYNVVNYEIVKFCKRCELNMFDRKSVTNLIKPLKYFDNLLRNNIKRKSLDRLLIFKYMKLKYSKSNSTNPFSYLYAKSNFRDSKNENKIILKVFSSNSQQDESSFHYKKRFRNSNEVWNSILQKRPKKIKDYSKFNFSLEKSIKEKENISESFIGKFYISDNEITKAVTTEKDRKDRDFDSFKVYKETNLLNPFTNSIYTNENKSTRRKPRLHLLNRIKRSDSINDEFKAFEQKKYNKNPFDSSREKSLTKHRSKVFAGNGQKAAVSNKSRSCSKCFSFKGSVRRVKTWRKIEKRDFKTVSNISKWKRNNNRKERKKRRGKCLFLAIF